MNLHTLIATKSDCYKTGQKIVPKGIMPHSTGANNPTLKRYVGPDDGKLGVNKNNNHWNNSGISACVHAFIGKLENGEVATYQILPWNHRGWHGAGTSNNTHISFEICEDGLTDGVYFAKVYQEAVELCVYLCREYNLTEKDILCHCEGHKKGIASNHADVMHWFPKHGKSMDTFRADVATLLKGDVPTPVTPSSSSSPSSFTSYTVKKTCTDGLNIRSGAGVGYDVVGVIEDTLSYTIVEEKDGWGKLKSGLGWISLAYTARQ